MVPDPSYMHVHGSVDLCGVAQVPKMMEEGSPRDALVAGKRGHNKAMWISCFVHMEL